MLCTKIDIPHSDNCVQASLRKKCQSCFRISRSARQRIRRANAKANIIQTRGVIGKNKKLYYDILCEDCKVKIIKKFCDDCRKKYKSYKNNRAKKAKLSNKSDQSNSTKLIRLNSDGSGNNGSGSENIGCGSSDICGTINKISKYANVLCNLCQNKATKEYCDVCLPKYNNAKNKIYYANKQKKSQQPSIANSSGSLSDSNINSELNPNISDGIVNGGSNDSQNDSSDSVDICSKKRSIYADFLCDSCQFKKKYEYCDKCKPIYKSVQNKSHRANKKVKIQQAEQNTANSLDLPYTNHSVSGGSGGSGSSTDSNSDLNPSKSDKTISNKASIISNMSGSPNSKSAIYKKLIKKLPLKNIIDIRKDLDRQINNSLTLDLCAEISENYRRNKNCKSTNDNFLVLQSMSPTLQRANPTKSKMREKLHVSKDTVDKIMSYKDGDQLQRKKKRGKYTDGDINCIKKFYISDNISRPNNGQISKRLNETIRYMSMTIKQAHDEYNIKYPNAQVRIGFFYQNKPKHVKVLNKTPFKECACVYCTNVRLKLIALGIPGINVEMELYKRLTCDKTSKYRNKECIFRECNDCKDWDKTIKSLASNLNMDKIEFGVDGNM